MKLNLQTKKSAPLHPDETRSEFDPALTADGRWLSFVQSRGNLSLALVVKDLKEDRQFEVARRAASAVCTVRRFLRTRRECSTAFPTKAGST